MSRAALIAAARAWHLSKRPPAWSAAEHARHPWVCVFGKEATQLAVACADGPDDCIIAAALAWYRAGMSPDPAFIDSVGLKEVIEQYLSTQSSDDDDNEEGEIMNLWQVSLPGKCRRFVASQADGREMRELFLQEYGVKKKDVIVEPVSVPTKKEDLIAYLNEAYASIDAAGVQS